MYYKRVISCVAAMVSVLGVVGCSSSSDSSSQADSSFTENVSVMSTDSISAIPEGAENELEWFSYYDLNPTKAQPERSTNLALFEQKGGKIKYSNTTSVSKYDDLAARLMSNNPPDMFGYEQKMTFPANCIKKMFQPVDSVVDLDSPLWKDVKETADQFVLNGEHYVVPVTFGALSMLTYDKSLIEANGLDDPYEIYKDGNWDWNAWYDIMSEYCKGASGDEERYGINGWISAFIFQSTGKTLISYDETTDNYVSNIDDPDLERAADFMYKINKENLYNSSWIGSASECFKNKVLFYAMGTWAVTPKEGDSWGIVPMPKDPNSDKMYTTLSTNAYMWVYGSTKAEAYKCWLECSKYVASDETYKQTNKDKFYVNQPYWTEEMYQVAFEDVISDKFTRLVDPGYGMTTTLSDDDAATNDSREAVIPFMYSSVTKYDDNDKQYTWTQLREKFRSTVDSELKSFNEAYHLFQKK